ncbi:MAG TPA: transposase [Candidatus Aquilonibacter sp.]|nr:transposase [Candidatus Aquilonibacter sp.]
MAANAHDEPRRRPLRIAGFDYSQPANYFVTICTHGHRQILGYVSGSEMRLNSAGAAVRGAWFDLPKRFPSIVLPEFVAMPNHVHAIIGLTRPIPPRNAGAASSAPTTEKQGLRYPSLANVVRTFKSVSAIEVNRILGRSGEPVWQRNYYEHIIRNAKEFQRICKYILENPSHWHDDPENI